MDIKEIKGKRILFFSPAFFNYENMIADKMREMGAYVDMYDARSVTSAIDRAILKVSPAFFGQKSKKYYEGIIVKNREKEYDFILFINCDMVPVSILKELRTVYPNSKLCLYLWDSVANVHGAKEKLKYFDILHSFDKQDCKRFKDLKFRPLFFGDQFRRDIQTKDYKYDICFLGTIHSDRYSVIKQVMKVAEQLQLRTYWFLYLQSEFIYTFYKLTKREFRDAEKGTFSFNKMSTAEIAQIVNESKIVLDVQHPRQTGLTMRTIEMIGMNKKLITTNQNIKEYDFFNPDNVAVINRKHVEIPMSFWDTMYKSVPNEIYEQYSLKNWILDTLSGAGTLDI